MSPKAGKGRRPRPAHPPTSPRRWVLKPASAAAQKEWLEALAGEPSMMAKVKERLQTRPLDRSDNPSRTHRLREPLDMKRIAGRNLPQWQHEMTAAGRIWYCPDAADHVVWITKVSLTPPRETHKARKG